jgi:hypothetical protein
MRDVAAEYGSALTVGSTLMIIMTDSKYVIEGLTVHLSDWENKGWIGIENANFFRMAAHLLRRRSAPTMFQWVKGHNGDLGNEESDRLAKEGANKAEPDNLPLDIPIDHNLQGAKLATMTQVLAYRGVHTRSTPPPRQSMRRNLDITKEAIRNFTQSHELDSTIWNNIQRKTIRPRVPRVQQFLLKAIHNTYMIGNFWSNIPGYEPRGQCSTCQSAETMDHILTSCAAEPVDTVWSLARETWPYPLEQWPEINLGIILGCGSLTIPKDTNAEGNRDQAQAQTNIKGRNRLLQIMVSKSAHLIWVLRCGQVINNRSHSAAEVQSCWIKSINTRLTEDKVIATKIKQDKASINLVKQTWEKVLQRNTILPHDWVHNREVLVGRRVQHTLY